jgi:aminopeptidase N
MMIIKLTRVLIIIIVLFVSLPAITAIPLVDTSHYKINMELMPNERLVRGSTTINLNTPGINNLILELDEDLEIKVVKRDGRNLDFSREKKKVIIQFSKTLSGSIQISMEYEGVLNETVNGHSWAYIDEESVYAVHESSWYPKVAEDRATAKITLQAPPTWTVVSNGALVSYDEKTNSFSWFVDSPEIGFSFAAGEYLEIMNYEKHRPIICYLLSPMEDCANDLKSALVYFSTQLVPYPYPKLALAEVKGNLNGGHGDNSLIIISSDIIGDPSFQEFFGHEAAHSWFGGMVTAGDSKWLTEGFATYAGIMYLESLDHNLANRALDTKRREYLSVRDKQKDQAIAEASNEYDDVYHATVYSKGAYVLHMLRNVVGDEVFSKSLKNYLDKYQGRRADVRDYIMVTEETSGMELDWFFDEWLSSTKVPDFQIESTRTIQINDRYIVSGVLTQKGDIMKMPIDVSLSTSGGEVKKLIWVESKTTPFEFQTEYKPIMLEIDKDKWLLEENRLNNRYVVKYPLNFYGLRLFLSNISLNIRSRY